MKTTVEMPDELFRRAKSAAALRGQTLRELITGAVEREVAEPKSAPEEISIEETIQGWESLAAQNAKAWKTSKSALQELTDMRNARGD